MTSSMLDMLDADDASLTDPLDIVHEAPTAVFNFEVSISISLPVPSGIVVNEALTMHPLEDDNDEEEMEGTSFSFDNEIEARQTDDLINNMKAIAKLHAADDLNGVMFALSNPGSVFNISDLIEDSVIIDLTHD